MWPTPIERPKNGTWPYVSQLQSFADWIVKGITLIFWANTGKHHRLVGVKMTLSGFTFPPSRLWIKKCFIEGGANDLNDLLLRFCRIFEIIFGDILERLKKIIQKWFSIYRTFIYRFGKLYAWLVSLIKQNSCKEDTSGYYTNTRILILKQDIRMFEKLSMHHNWMLGQKIVEENRLVHFACKFKQIHIKLLKIAIRVPYDPVKNQSFRIECKFQRWTMVLWHWIICDNEIWLECHTSLRCQWTKMGRKSRQIFFSYADKVVIWIRFLQLILLDFFMGWRQCQEFLVLKSKLPSVWESCPDTAHYVPQTEGECGMDMYTYSDCPPKFRTCPYSCQHV